MPDPRKEFVLPASPWTYENGALNPHLAASNARLRSVSQRRAGPVSALPPYHPDYEEPASEDGEDEEDGSEYESSSDEEGPRKGRAINEDSDSDDD